MRRKITKEAYDAMVEAYREVPDNHANAGRAGDCDRATARKAWKTGWPARGWPAISEVLKTERMEARARLEKQQERDAAHVQLVEQQELREAEERLREEGRRQAAAAEEARNDAIKNRMQEAEMVRSQRGNVIALIGLLNHNLRMSLNQVKHLNSMLETGKKDNGKALTLRDRLQIQRDTARIMEIASDAMKKVLEAERLLLGEPTEILGINLTNMSIEESEHVIEVSNRALERARKKGLVALPGGAMEMDAEGTNG